MSLVTSSALRRRYIRKKLACIVQPLVPLSSCDLITILIKQKLDTRIPMKSWQDEFISKSKWIDSCRRCRICETLSSTRGRSAPSNRSLFAIVLLFPNNTKKANDERHLSSLSPLVGAVRSYPFSSSFRRHVCCCCCDLVVVVSAVFAVVTWNMLSCPATMASLP